MEDAERANKQSWQVGRFSGLYIAHHSWLDAEYGPDSLYKVGHTGDLGARLTDSAYVTCFPPGWRYVATFELPTKEDAFLLETAVLHCCRNYRLGTRELVRMPAAGIVAVAEAAVAALGLASRVKRLPTYKERARAPQRDVARQQQVEPSTAATPSTPSVWQEKRSLVESLTVALVAASEAAPGSLAVNVPEADARAGSGGPRPVIQSQACAALVEGMRTLELGTAEGPRAVAPGTAKAVDSAETGLESAETTIGQAHAPEENAQPNCSDTFIDEILDWDFETVSTSTRIPGPSTAVPPSIVARNASVMGVVARAAAQTKQSTAQTSTRKADAEEQHKNDEDQMMGETDAALDIALDGQSPYDLLGTAETPLELREYQQDAVAKCVAELQARGCAVLQMACRCGKTPVGYGVMQAFLNGTNRQPGAATEPNAAVLLLVPGLSLLRQTAQKLARYGCVHPMLLVGSDTRPVPIQGRGATHDLLMTTDSEQVRAFLRGGGPRLVISTYQSSPQIPTDAFALMVFDESHRICGGRAPRPFNHMLLAPPKGARLFMTATPAYEGAISMKDRALFGGVAYRYHLRRGIEAGYVNNFRLEIVAAPADAAGGEEGALPAQIATAMATVDKLLVFCRDIKQATRLCAATQAFGARENFECLAAHSRMDAGGATRALKELGEPGKRVVLFNCRLFQEGVEIPALNGVFFAAPRHSPRDIIQCVCRPLNRLEDKPQSVVFLPVLHDVRRAPDDAANLKRFATIVPYVDALLAEDPGLYEYLLDPRAELYPLSVLGTRELGKAIPGLSHAGAQTAMLAAIRRAVRHGGSTAARPAERLLRAENVPWDRAFGEISRVVTQCGRYPKTTDLYVVGEARTNLHNLYRYYATQYKRWAAGDKAALEPFQATALEQLPGWVPFGLEGPYPWALCMGFLERWLEDSEGVPPMVEIHKGGYVGLDASMMERLSGCLTCVNQQVFGKRVGGVVKTANRVDPECQKDLDRICGRFGLRWRKVFKADGTVDPKFPTFIQEAYSRFKTYYEAHGADSDYIRKWFAGYPKKHSKQERLDVQAAGTAPPRARVVRKKAVQARDKT